MAGKKLVAYALVVILIVLAMTINGCSIPGIKKDNATVARDIVLEDPAVKEDIAASGGSYTSEARPADLNITGYLNYTGNFYHVFLQTATRGPGGPYLEQFDVLVDVESGREMQVSRRFDVAIYPERILVPAHAAWYRRFPGPARPAGSSDMPWAYIEINLSTLNSSIRPLLADEANFNQLRQGLPYDAWSLSSLGENATEVNLDGHNAPVITSISYITATPGILPMPKGSFFSGTGLKLILKDVDQHYYLVLINDGPVDVCVEAEVIG